MKIYLKQLNILISILLLAVVYYDYFLLNEYHIEGVALVGISALLCFNIIRNTKLKLNRWISILLYISILIVTFLCFYILLIASFGFGFTGKTTPWNHIFGVILTFGLMVTTILEFQNAIIHKK